MAHDHTERDTTIGDHVRWWPDGLDDDGRAIADRYIDGEVTNLTPLCIRVTGSRGFTVPCRGGWTKPAIGGVVDTSISPGAVQRMNPVCRVRTPAGDIPMRADPTLKYLTAKLPTTLNGQPMAVERDENAFAAAGPIPRPDGFDQRQVDAAKAALLAPVPPRYPRKR